MVRVKNLKGTTGCNHYSKLVASRYTDKSCCVYFCGGDGNNACHVIYANRNSSNGKRYIVYMCSSHNKTSGILNIRKNKMIKLPDCVCGF